jgi:hypothetical protein
MLLGRQSASVVLIFCFLSGAAHSQLREQQFVSRPSDRDVVRIVGSSLGFMPKRRVTVVEDGRPDSQPAQLAAVVSSEEDALSLKQRGVLFNYSMQAYGLTSGEICFEVRTGFDVGGLRWENGRLPRPLGPAQVFVVDASTGSEFLRILTMLRASSSVKWVEPTVQYISQAVE